MAKKGKKLFRLFIGLTFFVGFLMLVALVAAMIYFGKEAAKFPLEELGKMPVRSVVYDATGKEIGRLHGANRELIRVDQIPRHFRDALLAREDRNFYRHGGIDLRGVARALVRNLKDREFTQGASTLTMQLARNSYALTEKSLHRKLVEMMLARRIEGEYEKDEILQHYVNRIFFGSGLYGLQRASDAYFGKDAADLNLSEASLLVGIIRSPNRFSPFRNLEGALRERDVVLNRMHLYEMLSKDEMEAAHGSEIHIRPSKPTIRQDNWAMDAVRRELDDLPWDIMKADYIEDGGLHIHTTLNMDIQKAAEASLNERLRAIEETRNFGHPRMSSYQKGATKYLQGAVVAMDNETGGVLAIVGGRSYAHSKFNRALQAKRQIGSTFKPFVYGAAYQASDLLPGVRISDGRIDPVTELAEFNTKWSPKNSDQKFGGMLPAEDGLIRSRNTMTVRVGQWAGIDQVHAVALAAGLGEVSQTQPTVFLGSFETTLKEMTSAYSSFPNRGSRKQSYIISKIIDTNEETLFINGPQEIPVFQSGVNSLVHQGLEQVMVRGTGTSAKRLGWDGPAGGKTGTTNDYRDAWFMGYSSEVTCGVWVGLDQPQRIMAKGYGSRLALPVWVDVMKSSKTAGFTPQTFSKELPAWEMAICDITGGLASHSCGSTRIEATVPEHLLLGRESCPLHPGIPITPLSEIPLPDAEVAIPKARPVQQPNRTPEPLPEERRPQVTARSQNPSNNRNWGSEPPPPRAIPVPNIPRANPRPIPNSSNRPPRALPYRPAFPQNRYTPPPPPQRWRYLQ